MAGIPSATRAAGWSTSARAGAANAQKAAAAATRLNERRILYPPAFRRMLGRRRTGGKRDARAWPLGFDHSCLAGGALDIAAAARVEPQHVARLVPSKLHA